jgi:phosphatidylserine/phosphatidylglycerophosphate/cardiolipin synthase-like enzyme
VNRGVTAAKAYFKRFGDLDPSEVEPANAAYNWLSRGLKESLLGFIHSAKSGDKLHVAVCEFHDAEVAQAFKDALARGVELSILHDAKAGKRSTKESNLIIAEFGLESIRAKVNISHNKLVVLLRNNKPIRAWAGSANFSENAFNYQTNTALVVKDKCAVVAFEKYFQSLLGDPAKAHSKDLNRDLMDEVNQKPNCLAEKTFFSPIRKLEILDTAVDLIANAKHLVLISAPFGVDRRMIEAIEKNDRALVEYGLSNSTAKKKIAGLNHRIRRFFPPNRPKAYQGERWDAKAFGAHKVHAKTIVVAPL